MNQQVQTDIEPREGQTDESQTQETPVVREPADVAGSSAAEAAELGISDGLGERFESGERLVPVSEAKKYRKRAQAAEATLEDAKAQLAHNEEQIRRSEAMIASLERRIAIDEALVESDAVDLEASRLLVEQELEEGEAADVESAVAELQRRKPALFRSHRNGAAVAQAARDVNGHALHREQLVRTATVAAATGHRHDVLRYLRLRRRS